MSKATTESTVSLSTVDVGRPYVKALIRACKECNGNGDM